MFNKKKNKNNKKRNILRTALGVGYAGGAAYLAHKGATGLYTKLATNYIRNSNRKFNINDINTIASGALTIPASLATVGGVLGYKAGTKAYDKIKEVNDNKKSKVKRFLHDNF